MFGARVCVKRSDKRRVKLDKHSFSGIVIGYTDTIKNVRHINSTTVLIKMYGHTTFDEAWYCAASRPPAAQLLYDLGLVVEDGNGGEDVVMKKEVRDPAPYPPCPGASDIPSAAPLTARMEVLRLRLGAEPRGLEW